MQDPNKTLSATLDELIALIASFDQEQFNTVPFEGSWTAARVAQHLYLALKGMPIVITGPATATERAPDEKVGQLKTIFLNMDTKFKSPDFIFPEDKIYDRDDLLEKLEKVRSGIVAAIADLDLSLTAGFELPGLGPLTRLESIWFAVYHTQRHNQQLKNIREKIAG